jgi:damage-control phosphatase, subfamily I
MKKGFFLEFFRLDYVVRENPILNDATMLDAKESGMLDLCRVITNGTGYPGTVFEKTPLKLQEMFHNADVVIAKGQGNFETMCDLQHKALFFLLMVKCPVISQIIDCEVNSLVLMRR